eukprot:SAG31_NODE_1018_length_10354_cov_10.995514_12_plen_133_part_00
MAARRSGRSCLPTGGAGGLPRQAGPTAADARLPDAPELDRVLLARNGVVAAADGEGCHFLVFVVQLSCFRTDGTATCRPFLRTECLSVQFWHLFWITAVPTVQRVRSGPGVDRQVARGCVRESKTPGAALEN